jgi:hypothetical protein
MNRKPAGVPRTWHSLWDEMFSAFSVSDSSAAWYEDFEEAVDACAEQVAVLKLHEAANDNYDGELGVDAASRTQPCVPIDPDSLRDSDDD